MRFAYADPPYLGCGASHYGAMHPASADYDRVETHAALIERLSSEYDAWALSLHSPSLRQILPLCPDDVRVCAWVKPFASFKPGVNPGYAWEPVIIRGGRAPDRARRRRRAARIGDSQMTIAGHHNPGAAAERPARYRHPLAGVLPGDPLTAREADLLAALGRGLSIGAAARLVGVTRPHAQAVLLRRAKYKLGVKTTIEAVLLAGRA